MTLEDYQTEWEKDAPFDLSKLDEEARNIYIRHAHWWRYYTTERLRYKKLDYEYKALYQLRFEYWNGRLDDEVRKEHGWPVQPLKVLSPQLPIYLDADPVLQEIAKKRTVAEEALRFLEDVIKAINHRNYALSTALGYMKFKMGV